jgi:hypothetical protein
VVDAVTAGANASSRVVCGELDRDADSCRLTGALTAGESGETTAEGVVLGPGGMVAVVLGLGSKAAIVLGLGSMAAIVLELRGTVAIVRDAGGHIVGRTRLQKIAFMLEPAGLGGGFPFRYKHYGPCLRSDAIPWSEHAPDKLGRRRGRIGESAVR